MLLNASASMNDDVDYLVSNGVKKHRLKMMITTKNIIVTISGINMNNVFSV